jgi:inorganic pyrophosphatase
MNIWHDMDPLQITPEDFSAVIEIPKGSQCKYELDKHTGLLRLDRVLYTSTHYPANYGFIPRTYADDGDPLDVLVLCNMPLYPLTLVQVYPIGVMRMIDGGKLDDKIIALPFSDPTYHDVRDVSELPPHIFDEIMHFFTVYKQLENKQTAVKELFGHAEAERIIAEAIAEYERLFAAEGAQGCECDE